MGWRINFYNKRSSKNLGWVPEWLDASAFDADLERKVKQFQRNHDLKADGMVGPTTYRRLLLWKETYREGHFPKGVLVRGEHKEFVCDRFKIDLLNSSCYRKVSYERKPKMIVTHWDVCTSADSCKRVLEKRSISTHFVIDNDGTIVQLVDTNNIAWHARGANNHSIGIDVSNAYYTKYNSKYERMGFDPRPILTDSKVHGRKLKAHLGYYKEQISAYTDLIDYLTQLYDIPLEYPKNHDGSLCTTVYDPAVKGRFKGVINHYNLTKNKIDTAGLKLDEIISSIKEKRS